MDDEIKVIDNTISFAWKKNGKSKKVIIKYVLLSSVRFSIIKNIFYSKQNNSNFIHSFNPLIYMVIILVKQNIREFFL